VLDQACSSFLSRVCNDLSKDRPFTELDFELLNLEEGKDPLTGMPIPQPPIVTDVPAGGPSRASCQEVSSSSEAGR